jgi:hypothetical protein
VLCDGAHSLAKFMMKMRTHWEGWLDMLGYFLTWDRYPFTFMGFSQAASVIF